MKRSKLNKFNSISTFHPVSIPKEIWIYIFGYIKNHEKYAINRFLYTILKENCDYLELKPLYTRAENKVKEVLSQFSNIRKINFSKFPINNLLYAIQNLTKLESIILNNINYQVNAFPSLTHLTKLKAIALRNIPYSNYVGINIDTHLPINLVKIKLNSIEIKCHPLFTFTNFTKLEEITLKNVYFSVNREQVNANISSYLPINLKKLVLNNIYVPFHPPHPQAPWTFTNLTRLESITLIELGVLHAPKTIALSPLTNLTSIQITLIYPETICISDLVSDNNVIKKLVLNNISIKDYSHLSKLKNLKEFTIGNSAIIPDMFLKQSGYIFDKLPQKSCICSLFQKQNIIKTFIVTKNNNQYNPPNTSFNSPTTLTSSPLIPLQF